MKQNEELPILPKGWVWTKLGNLCELTAGGAAPQGDEFFKDGKHPFVRVQDMGRLGNTVYILDTKDHLNDKGIVKLRAFSKGTVLFTKSGMSTLLNQRAILPREMFVVSHIGVILPFQGVSNEWIYYYLKIVDFKDLTHATTLPSLPLPKVAGLDFPLPPLPEQHRIVVKIEELLTRLDAGVEALKKIQLQLKRYRQSVLKSAFNGELTTEWRKVHKGEFEPASVLLEKIKQERKKSVKYKELPSLDTTDLPELPEGWVWARVRDISSAIQYGTSDKANEEPSGIPVIRMGNIQEGRLDFKKLKYLPKEYPQIGDFLLQDGDILFNRTNSAELVGKSAVYSSSHPKAVFASYLIRIRIDGKAYAPEVLSYYINSFYGRVYINSVVSQQVGQANVNGTKLSLMSVPLFSLAEQKILLEEINLCFSVADKIEETITQSLKQSERLRQSILKRAFEGELLPQNPDDEHAEKLLERIKTEKAKQQASSITARAKNKRNLTQGRLV